MNIYVLDWILVLIWFYGLIISCSGQRGVSRKKDNADGVG